MNEQCLSEVPMLLVITKIDKVQDIRETLEERIQELKEQLGLIDTDEKVFQMVLYCSAAMEKQDDLGTTEMHRMVQIDKRLCVLWKKIMDPSYRNITAPEEKTCIII